MFKKPFSPTTRPLAASALAMFLAVPICASATSFNISTAVSSAQTLSGAETGTVTSTGLISIPQNTAITIANGATGNVSNAGTISSAPNGTWASGINATGAWGGSLTNSGTIHAGAKSNWASARGVYVDTWNNANALNNNGGTISASAVATNSDAVASGVSGITLNGNLTNSGTIEAIANARFTTWVEGLNFDTMTGTLANSGAISATATSNLSSALAYDINLTTLNGDIVNNAGATISATATAWSAAGAQGVAVVTLNGSLTNSGTISAQATDTRRRADAYGVYLGDMIGTLTNNGTIGATATSPVGMASDANGISVSGTLTGDIVNNAGATISATAPFIASAASVNNMVGNVTNSGNINATATGDMAWGYAYGLGVNGILTGDIVNNAGATISATATAPSRAMATGLSIGTLNGSLTNSGIISAQATTPSRAVGTSGIIIGDMTGTLTNNDTIASIATGGWGDAYGIDVSGTLRGDIVNNTGATINAAAPSAAIAVNVWNMAGNITNKGTISANGSGAGVYVAGGMTGNITNTGTISSTLGDGIRINNGAGLTTASGASYALNGSITNSGIITSYSSGININGSLVGDITNSGSIISTGMGDGINIDGSVTGSITNVSGATITSTAGTGIAVGAISSGGNITNSGDINGFFYGINVATNNAGTIDNRGVITAPGVGIHMVGSNAADTGTILNSGAISTTDGNAIRIDVAAAGYNYVITNTGTITTPTGAYGINVQGLAGTGTLNQNAGTISGMGVLMGIGNDTVNINGGAIIGNIDASMELVGGADTLNFNASHYLLQGSVNSFEVINFNNGVTDLNGHAFYGGGDATIASGAQVIFNGGETDGNVTNHGILNAGAGTSIIWGDYTQTAGSTTRLDIYHGANDLVGSGPSGSASYLEINGLATLGNVEAHISGSDYIPDGSSYYVMETPTLSDLDTTHMVLSDNSAVLDFTADTTTIPGGLFLTANRVATYQSLAGSSYANLAGQLDTLGASGLYTAEQQALLGALDASPTGTAVAQKLADMSPDATGAELEGSRSVTTTVGNVIGQRIDSQLASAGHGTGMAAGDAFRDSGIWLQGFFGNATQDGSLGNNGYDASNSGFVIGGDTSVTANARVGLSLASTKNKIDIAGGATPDKHDIDSTHITVYGSYEANSWNLAGMIASSSHDYDSTRNGVNKASYSGSQLTMKVQGGFPMEMGGMKVTPVASFSHSTLDLDGYTETGPGALTVRGSSYDSNELGIGALVAKEIKGGSLTWVPRASLRYRHELGDVKQETNATLNSAGISFTTNGIERSRGTVEVGLGVDMLSGERFALQADYQLDSRGDYSANTGRLSVRYKF